MTPYQRIVVAAKHGKGIRLTAQEVAQMSRDTAIRQLAENDFEDAHERLEREAGGKR